MKWLSIHWWRYLLSGCKGWRHFLCRARGHHCGVWWFTGPDAVEPDMHCKNCGEDLG